MFRRAKNNRLEAEGPSAAETLRPLLFGDVPVDEFVSREAETDAPPWAEFARARQALADHDPDVAVELWSRIAATPGLESRPVLQAWTFLRQAGHPPNETEAKTVLGAVVEMPIGSGHDVIAAYADGSARYLNHAGGVVVMEADTLEAGRVAVRAWLDLARSLVRDIGPWDQPQLPALPPGHLRITMLTPSGPHFGQGPQEQLMSDPAATRFVEAAAVLLQVLVASAAPQP